MARLRRRGLRVTQNEDGSYVPVTSMSTEAMVYTGAARLTIQQIDPAKTLTWDPSSHAWTGEGAIATPTFNMATWERTADGPCSYGAETVPVREPVAIACRATSSSTCWLSRPRT
jgi:hypothetical protein